MQALEELVGKYRYHTTYCPEELTTIIIDLLMKGYSRNQVADALGFRSTAYLHQRAEKILGFKLKQYAHPTVGNVSAIHLLEEYNRDKTPMRELAARLGVEREAVANGLSRARSWLKGAGANKAAYRRGVKQVSATLPAHTRVYHQARQALDEGAHLPVDELRDYIKAMKEDCFPCRVSEPVELLELVLDWYGAR